uniref:Nuclear hormone receptor HR96 n=1 Tax=Ditylenchus dipsaci TaxID=166011 RepID=A0A915EAW5_9BILA
MTLNEASTTFNSRAIATPNSTEPIVTNAQCKVCGDKSAGYNFGVLTCESCKAFYRRNCQREKQMKCPFMSICEINKMSRRFCQSCRLQKCIKVGMRKEKLARKSSSSKPYSPKEEHQPVVGFEVVDSTTSIIRVDKCECTCKCGFYAEGTALTAKDTNMIVQVKTELASSDPHLLTPYDQLMLEELQHANTILDAPLIVSLNNFPHTNKVDPFNLSLLDVVRISDLAMRRIISMAKQLSTFMGLIQEDQIALLKGGLTELLILRGQWSLIRPMTFGNMISTALTTKLAQIQAAEQQHYLEHKRFLSSFKEEWRQNSTIMLLVNAICLFCPRRPHILNVEQVATIQNNYKDLLKRFLFTECKEENSIKEPDIAYTLLMAKFEELHLLNKSLHLIYGELNPKDLDPLLQELLQYF